MAVGVTVGELAAERDRANELALSVKALVGERESLRAALDRRDKELAELRRAAESLEAALASERAAGLRQRSTAGGGSDAATAAAKVSTTRAGGDDDDDTGPATGFPLWQVLLVALIALLVGRLLAGVV